MKTVLIVDDESSLVESLADILGWNGYGVATARNGREGLEKLRASPPAVLLVDFMMPVMNGVEMLAELRRDTAYQRLPAVLMTASPPALAAAEAGRLWDALLTKPFDLEDLLATVARLIGAA